MACGKTWHIIRPVLMELGKWLKTETADWSACIDMDECGRGIALLIKDSIKMVE